MIGRVVKMLAMVAFGSATMFATQVTVSIASGFAPNGGQAPYTALVNGITTTVICDDSFDTIAPPETWTANVLMLNNLNASNYKMTEFGSMAGSLSAATKLYDEVAYLALQFGANPIANWGGIQTAIWHIFDANASTVAGTGKTSTAYWTNLAGMATNQAIGAANAYRIEILTPNSPQRAPGKGGPQEFIVVTPEPATYALFGMGLILLSLGTYRRRNKKSE